MESVRRALAVVLLSSAALAQETRPAAPFPTAVYTLADHHTSRWTGERDPLVTITGVCRITPGQPHETLTCPPAAESGPRVGRRHFYSVALFRDLEETLYLAACAAPARDTNCEEIRAGETFSAEVEDQTIRIVMRDTQVPLRILERRPRPPDSRTVGTPSQVRPSAGAPSAVPYSQVPPSRGAPADVRPSEASTSTGAPSHTPPSEASTAAASPTSGRLYLYSSVGSARVFLDGQLVGQPPVEVPLLPGRHVIRVQATGYRDWVRTVQVPPGGTVRMTADLQR